MSSRSVGHSWIRCHVFSYVAARVGRVGSFHQSKGPKQQTPDCPRQVAFAKGTRKCWGIRSGFVVKDLIVRV